MGRISIWLNELELLVAWLALLVIIIVLIVCNLSLVAAAGPPGRR
jgi:hypothetical protein